MKDTHMAPISKNIPAKTNMFICRPPNMWRMLPPPSAAMICGIHIVPLNNPR